MENLRNLLRHIIDYANLVGTSLSTILLCFVLSYCIFTTNSIFAKYRENLSDFWQLFLLIAPFMLGLAFEYVYCKIQYNKLLLSNLDDVFSDTLFQIFSHIMEFLIVAEIAFLVFLKSSLYDFLELTVTSKLTNDILFGWLVSATVVIRITFDSACSKRRAQQKTIHKHTITEQRRSQRIIVYPKRIYHNYDCSNVKPSLKVTPFVKLRQFLNIDNKS